jgi:transcriptional regulator with XRE-family HTH domain
MSATLGGLIKDLRIQKNIPQVDIAFALGWKEASRLSRIEQGKVEKPKRELLGRLMNAMNLTKEERNNLYYVGNYLPTAEELEEVVKSVKPVVDEWPYPAACLDYTWRIIYSNQKIFDIFNIPPEIRKVIENEKPCLLEVVLHPNSPLRTFVSDEEKERGIEFFKRLLIHFQDEQKNRINEKWYQDLIKRLMGNDIFSDLWPKIQQQTKYDFDVSKFGNKVLMQSVKDDGKTLDLYFFLVPVFKDPRFDIEFYVPANLESYKYFEEKYM